MKTALWSGLTVSLLAACATVPPQSLPARDSFRHFTVDGRFALKSQHADGTAQHLAGRLSWTHQADSDTIVLSSPLGVGLAEIASSPQGAQLRTGNGEIRAAVDADQLLAEVTGETLPVRRLPDWLLGRPSSAGGQLRQDTAGRPRQLDEAGWRIDYAYDNDDPAALPSRLTLRRPPSVDLRLRLENWTPLP